ncbi:hypothetical protein [Intrasporangium sp.]|jgi:hypothetical protein|uniref:hypothetical protein n=1 Tax=Intrasporangium sp. TaxID=1925024 RepID=UPI00336569E3
MDPIDANDPILPIDRIDPALPIDRIEFVDPIDRIDPCDLKDHFEGRLRLTGTPQTSVRPDHCMPLSRP